MNLAILARANFPAPIGFIQDAFLNVVGEVALFAAVIGFSSSLWTARLAYCARNGIPHDDVVLVSGQVEPDNCAVDTIAGQIVLKTLGAKPSLSRGKRTAHPPQIVLIA